MTKQDNFDANIHLLMASAYLACAEKLLGKPNQKHPQDAAYWTWQGVNCVKKAMKELEQEDKEETCPSQ